jgi:hypothetical protein
MVKGLICIDLWEEGPGSHDAYQRWLDDLIARLTEIDFHSVINASFHTRIDFDDVSMYNTFVKNNWSEFNEEIMMSIVKDCNNYVMSKKIINSIFKSHSFFYNRTEHFLQHQKQLVPHVTDWLVVGNTWPCCTHRKEMGLRAFSRLKERPDFAHLEFYGATWGFIKEDCSTCTAEDFARDDMVKWQQIGPELFKLM